MHGHVGTSGSSTDVRGHTCVGGGTVATIHAVPAVYGSRHSRMRMAFSRGAAGKLLPSSCAPCGVAVLPEVSAFNATCLAGSSHAQ